MLHILPGVVPFPVPARLAYSSFHSSQLFSNIKCVINSESDLYQFVIRSVIALGYDFLICLGIVKQLT